MRIWLSNSRSELSFEREFFALVCNKLIVRRGAGRVAERFQTLAVLSSLPWLDQPRVLEPTRLIFEIHEAWEDLAGLHLEELGPEPVYDSATRQRLRRAGIGDEDVLGRYLARPFHELTVFAALAGASARMHAATHPRLLVDAASPHRWRVIQGGMSAAGRDAPSAALDLNR